MSRKNSVRNKLALVVDNVVPPPPNYKSVDEIPLFLTVPDMCALFQISRSSLIRQEKTGDFPARLMIGGSVRYDRAVVEKWVRDASKP